MFSLGCSCGRTANRTPLSQGQEDCFSYVVSVDGVHVCYRHNIIENESVEEDEPESNAQDVVKNESREEDAPQRGSTEDAASEPASNPQELVEHEATEAAAPKRECPDSLLQRRGRSLSKMRLALSTSTPSTLSDHPSDESTIAGTPSPKSGRYELIRQIGVDGEGVIHLMKTLNPPQLLVRKTVTFARFAHSKPIEATVLQDLFPDRHNNIICLHAFEAYRIEGARYYLEYCSGGDLHQLVNQYRNHELLLPEPFIWQAYQQLASALEFLHRGFDPRRSDPDRPGICHRDIKPSNIFLRPTCDSEYPDVVLADFGHATLDFATYDPAGTMFWQPPELPRHSPRGDVYSLGAVIHFLIHFEAPIADMPDGTPDTESEREAWAAAPQARQPKVEYVEEYSEEVVCAMLMALEKEESKRKNASQLLGFVEYCMEMRFRSDDHFRQEMEEWPMAGWAFDHMVDGRGGVVEEEEEDNGTEQYFEMMRIFGCGTSRESSRSSFAALTDWRRGIAVPSDSLLGETY